MVGLIKKIFKTSSLKIAICVILTVLALFFLDPPFLRYIELKTYDIRMVYRGERVIGPETAVVAIDEKSVTELGRWPWSRAVMAELVRALKAQGVRTIGFDIVFSEPEEDHSLKTLDDISAALNKSASANHAMLELLRKKKRELDTDATFASAIADAANVTLGYLFHFSPAEVAHLKEEDISAGADSIAGSRYGVIQYKRPPEPATLFEARAPLANLEELSSKAENSGFFNAFPDKDGTIRWSPLVIKFRDSYYSSLSVSLLMQYLDWPDTRLFLDTFGVAGIRIGNSLIPTDHTGRMLINYLGPDGVIPHYSAVDVIKGRIPPGTLKDRIVIVGATAIGIYDLRVTPYSPVSAGVNIHATVIDNILRQSFIVRSFAASLLDVLAIISLGLLAGFFVPRLRAVPALLFIMLLTLSFLLVNFLVFSRLNVWLSLVYPMASFLFAYMGITVHKFFTEEKEKKKIRSAFQYYLTSSVINEMLKDPTKLKLGGQKKDLTVLFSDIRGFTSVAEVMSPEELVQLLNEYLTAMTDLVFKYDGLLDKYMGDAIMAVYGAPLDQPDHALRACKTSLEMLFSLDVLREKWRQEGRPDLDIGIGINSGDMVVGNMGSQMRFDYTVMGDRVNLGSRLEGLNKVYGTRIILSEYTRDVVADQLVLRELDSVRVKGKAIPVKIYELLGTQREMTDSLRDFISRFEEGLASYRDCRWDEASRLFEEALKIRSADAPSRLYLERIEKLKIEPPPQGWDGVFTMESK
ncbi:MAG: adenylate/guanylate cyclase domain-containing protein [Smithellaceae bacterium]|nr:adenylate/guanylate cyclase domain-containing protein [Smithellaceae bacterium]